MSRQQVNVSNGNKALDQWREEIDKLDSELLRLLNQRADIACRIAGIKVASALPAYDAAREEQVLSRIAGQNSGPLDEHSVRAIFSSIIHETRRLGTERMRQLSESAAQTRVNQVRGV